MGFRSFLRDGLVFYLAYKIIKGYLFHDFHLDGTLVLLTLLLLLMTVWFLLEKMGILAKMD